MYKTDDVIAVHHDLGNEFGFASEHMLCPKMTHNSLHVKPLNSQVEIKVGYCAEENSFHLMTGVMCEARVRET